MKQGTGKNYSGPMKVEPRSTAVPPARAADIGIQQIRTRPAPAYKTVDGMAPKMSTETHHCGSQGKH